MEETHSTTYGERVGSFHALSEHVTLPQSPPVQRPGSSLNLVLLGFYGGLMTQARLVKSLAIGD